MNIVASNKLWILFFSLSLIQSFLQYLEYKQQQQHVKNGPCGNQASTTEAMFFCNGDHSTACSRHLQQLSWYSCPGIQIQQKGAHCAAELENSKHKQYITKTDSAHKVYWLFVHKHCLINNDPLDIIEPCRAELWQIEHKHHVYAEKSSL